MQTLFIKFVGKNSDAPEFLRDGQTRIDLPKTQAKPFAHPDAKRILAVAPSLYKRVVKKDGKALKLSPNK